MEQNINRRQREKLRHRKEILNAAEQVFSQNGFHRTTMEDIAACSEFAVGTLYKFFSSKDEMYQTLIGERFHQLRDEVMALMSEISDPLEIIKTYIQAKIDLAARFISFAKLYTRERLGDRFTDSDLWWKTCAPLYQEVMGLLARTFQRGIEQNYFRKDISPEDMTIALEGVTDGFMYNWLMFPDQGHFGDKYDTMVRLFIEGISQR